MAHSHETFKTYVYGKATMFPQVKPYWNLRNRNYNNKAKKTSDTLRHIPTSLENKIVYYS